SASPAPSVSSSTRATSSPSVANPSSPSTTRTSRRWKACKAGITRTTPPASSASTACASAPAPSTRAVRSSEFFQKETHPTRPPTGARFFCSAQPSQQLRRRRADLPGAVAGDPASLHQQPDRRAGRAALAGLKQADQQLDRAGADLALLLVDAGPARVVDARERRHRHLGGNAKPGGVQPAAHLRHRGDDRGGPMAAEPFQESLAVFVHVGRLVLARHREQRDAPRLVLDALEITVGRFEVVLGPSQRVG